MRFKEIGLRAQIFSTVLGSMVNVTVRQGEESILPFNEHENLHFDNEKDIKGVPNIMRKMSTGMIRIHTTGNPIKKMVCVKGLEAYW